MLAVFHVLDQHLAVADDGVKRRAQVVAQAAMEIVDALIRLAAEGRVLDQPVDE